MRADDLSLMPAPSLSYAIITPARDEATNLVRLARCLLAQSSMPLHWVVVDNGSGDGTAAFVRTLAEEHAWITLVELAGTSRPMRETAIGRAVEAGLEAVRDGVDLVVKVDADVGFEPEFFDAIVSTFASEERLGIASGIGYERDRRGIWKQRHGTGAGVWGAVRAFRRECLEEILPLDARLGWDGIDIIKAKLGGWTARVIYEAPFRHHRPEGDREGSRWRVWVAEGAIAYYLNYRLSYLIVRTMFRVIRDPRAFGILWGYVGSLRRTEVRCADRQVIDYLRNEQRLTQLYARAREAMRRREVLVD